MRARSSLGSGVVVFVGAGEDGKASVVVAVTDDLTGRFSAVDLVRVASAASAGRAAAAGPTWRRPAARMRSKAKDAIAAVKAALEAA